MKQSGILLIALFAFLVGCGDDDETQNADSGNVSDASIEDTGSEGEDGSAEDSGIESNDAEEKDSTTGNDSSAGDGSETEDAGTEDATESDTGEEDAGETDAETGDSGETDAGEEVVGNWSVSVIDEQPAFKSRAAFAVGPQGELHVVYNVATDPEGWYTPAVWYGVLDGSEWKTTLVAPADGISNEFPNIVIDSKNKPHIFYKRAVAGENQNDLFYITTDDGGAFTAPVNVTGTGDMDEFAVALAIDGTDAIHLLFQEKVTNTDTGESLYSLGYIEVADGVAGPKEKITDESAQFSLNPHYSIAVTSDDGVVHVVYCKPGDLDGLNNVLYYKQKNGTEWSAEERLTETDMDVWDPVMVDGTRGELHLAYTKSANWEEKTLYYKRRSGGVWGEEAALSSSLEDRTYYLGMARSEDNTVHIAFSRFYDSFGDILYVAGKDDVFDAIEKVTDTADMDETDPDVAVTPAGKVYIVFVENLKNAPNGKVYIAERK